MTYMAHEDGLITEAMAEDNFWYSDGYGDNIRQFLAGMGSMPEWAPPEENHLLYSSSVVTEVSYGTNELRYSTFDRDATETLRLAFDPGRVTVGGIALTKRPDPILMAWCCWVAATKPFQPNSDAHSRTDWKPAR